MSKLKERLIALNISFNKEIFRYVTIVIILIAGSRTFISQDIKALKQDKKELI